MKIFNLLLGFAGASSGLLTEFFNLEEKKKRGSCLKYTFTKLSCVDNCADSLPISDLCVEKDSLNLRINNQVCDIKLYSIIIYFVVNITKDEEFSEILSPCLFFKVAASENLLELIQKSPATTKFCFKNLPNFFMDSFLGNNLDPELKENCIKISFDFESFRDYIKINSSEYTFETRLFFFDVNFERFKKYYDMILFFSKDTSNESRMFFSRSASNFKGNLLQDIYKDEANQRRCFSNILDTVFTKYGLLLFIIVLFLIFMVAYMFSCRPISKENETENAV